MVMGNNDELSLLMANLFSFSCVSKSWWVSQEAKSLENTDCLGTAYLIIVCNTGGLPNKITTLLCITARKQDVLLTRFFFCYLKVKFLSWLLYLIPFLALSLLEIQSFSSSPLCIIPRAHLTGGGELPFLNKIFLKLTYLVANSTTYFFL